MTDKEFRSHLRSLTAQCYTETFQGCSGVAKMLSMDQMRPMDVFTTRDFAYF